MPLSIKIDNFEGPFDLLLHLIRKNEMDIYDIKIYEITAQYLQHLEKMKEMDLEVTSEFIVIAATLIEIKSKMLLPKTVKETTVEDEEDPRKELIDKLIEYKKYKAIVELLKEKEKGAGIVFSKKPEIIEEMEDKKFDFKGTTMLDLYNIFNELMERYVEKLNKQNIDFKEIPVDAFKIEDKMAELREIIRVKERIEFRELIQNCSVKIEAVVLFLALLELIKLRAVSVKQETNFKEIYIERIIDHEGD